MTEIQNSFTAAPETDNRRGGHSGYLYRAPRDLRRSPYKPRRVLVIGACLVEPIANYINATGFNTAEFVLFNHLAQPPHRSTREIEGFDFQLVQIPIRSVMPEGAYLGLAHADVAGHADLFDECAGRLELLFDTAMCYNQEHGFLTLVTNFLSPQQNPMGRLFPKYDLRNPAHFIGELNRRLCGLIEARRNAYLLDADEIAANHGRRFYQDDAVWLLSHGSTVNRYDHPFDQGRIEPPEPIDSLYDLRLNEYEALVWHEAEALYDSLGQTDAVKMVVIDLDDTLWRGELAEQGEIALHLHEGWPLGFVEALLFLKKRGVILGVISKNTEETIVRLWPQAIGKLLRLDDFATRQINWRSKPENMRAILSDTNLLPASVVYIDDHPVQRAAMAEAFPDMRVIGRDPYYTRRILLWSPETQGATVTEESARRTTMIQAQVRRESHRKAITPEAFLTGLQLKLSMDRLNSQDAPALDRCFELLNKTNQFNTTGMRWSLEEVQAFLADDGVIAYGSAEDRFTAYGIVWVSLIRRRRIEQAVMSCRVAGLGVEIGAMSAICSLIAADAGEAVCAASRDTPHNLLSRDLFERCGFQRSAADEDWRLDTAKIAAPSHIHLELASPADA